MVYPFSKERRETVIPRYDSFLRREAFWFTVVARGCEAVKDRILLMVARSARLVDVTHALSRAVAMINVTADDVGRQTDFDGCAFQKTSCNSIQIHNFNLLLTVFTLCRS